jgi:hypothetical protein
MGRSVMARDEMAQMGFFDADRRLSVLSAKGDPLEAISKLVHGKRFVPT